MEIISSFFLSPNSQSCLVYLHTTPFNSPQPSNITSIHFFSKHQLGTFSVLSPFRKLGVHRTTKTNPHLTETNPEDQTDN